LPKLFGGWLYELLHRWQLFNYLCLVLWWLGIPIFTEGPFQFLDRTRLGLEELRTKAGAVEKVYLLCHLETFIVLRMMRGNKGKGETPIKAFDYRRRVRHLHQEEFII
jgi:hypothetical protein